MFEKEILELINLKQEGSYWDFKKEWYTNKQKHDLLHDIICMANNLVNKDAYIIIGVDEEKNYGIADIALDSNRKNTQKLVDFLKDKKFAGELRPVVLVKTLMLDGNIIDVIIIKNSYNTPFFLRERYQSIPANNIYTRIMDTNTPVNKSADIHHIEYLWKKRFRILSTPLERVEYYIDKPKEWLRTPFNYEVVQKYYKYNPEFLIEYTIDDQGDAYQYYLFNQSDIRPHWNQIRIYYHQTLIYNCEGVHLDGGRYFTPVPLTSGISFNSFSTWDVSYKYFSKNSLLFKIHNFYYEPDGDEADTAYRKFRECVLIFETDEELKIFNQYVKDNWHSYLENINIDKIWCPNFPEISGYDMSIFKKEFINVQILQEMLVDFREANEKKTNYTMAKQVKRGTQ